MLLALAVATLLLWWGLTVDWALGVRSMATLRRANVPEPARWPALSVVIPARDEAPALETTLESLLRQELPGLEVVVVDDRSHDATRAIAERVAGRDERVRVLGIDALPAGWLGKTHALQRGADAANGDWLLFADADVRFAPGALRRALVYALSRELDHLVVLPRLEARGALLRSFVAAFGLLFSVYTRPWRARDPRSRAAIGIGAFGLVRRHAYRAVGGHTAIRLRPDDDLSLGRLLKHGGCRQEAVFGADDVAVEWYPDLGAALRGLNKNAFAGMGYSTLRVAAVVVALLLTNVLPFVLLPFVGGPVRWVNALVVATVAFVYAFDAPRLRHGAWLFVLHPVGTTLLAYAAAASAAKALRRGQIEWRGTRYSLDELRQRPTPSVEGGDPSRGEGRRPREDGEGAGDAHDRAGVDSGRPAQPESPSVAGVDARRDDDPSG
ncbi:MAG: glycosyltransferase family 2 protein [Deinococcales bacterium]